MEEMEGMWGMAVHGWDGGDERGMMGDGKG